MYVVKRDGRKEAVKFDKITARIKKLCWGLDDEFVDPVRFELSCLDFFEHLDENSTLLISYLILQSPFTHHLHKHIHTHTHTHSHTHTHKLKHTLFPISKHSLLFFELEH